MHAFARTTILLICAASLATAQTPAPVPPAPPPATQPGAAPQLTVDTTEWNFGEVWQGEELKKDVQIKNTGNATLEISKVEGSCGCTPVTQPKTPLAPGESSSFTIRYDAHNKTGDASQRATIYSNDPRTPKYEIRVVGHVKKLFEILPTEGLLFGQLFQSSTREKKVDIVNRGPNPMILALRENESYGPFKIELQEVEPGQKYTLTATSRPPLKIGHFQSMVTIKTNWEKYPEIKSTIFGYVDPTVVLQPAKLFLPRGAAVERRERVLLKHAPDVPVEITAVKPNVDVIRVEWSKIGTGPDGKPCDDYQLTITLPPGNRIPEDVEPKIEITTTATDPAFQKVILPVQMIPVGAAGRAIITAPGGQQPAPAPGAPTGQTTPPASQPAKPG
jgi:hypothetical protein